MKNKLSLLAGTIVLGFLGICFVQPAAAQTAPVPFVTTVVVNPLVNFNYTQVTIPAGKRLIVDYVSMSGAAFSSSGAIQPIVILNTTLGTGPGNLFYFAPPANAQLPTQFYMVQPTVIYADTLFVGPAFAGFSPSFDTFSVVISGHLVAAPTPVP